MNDKVTRHVFFVSDSTGITAEALGQSLLSQFEHVEFECVTLPYIDNEEKAQQAMQQITELQQKKSTTPIIFTTLVDKKIRDSFATAGKVIDLFQTFLVPLEEELQCKSSFTIGGSRSVSGSKSYKTRINAVNYALNNDDGHAINQYPMADLIIIGISRCGKTPTCLYMALQFGVLVANYPLTEDQLSKDQLPSALKPYKNKLFGLTIDPVRLSSIRQERMPDSRYASLEQCRLEVNEASSIMRREQIPIIDTSELSIEEISTRILATTGVRRQVWKK